MNVISSELIARLLKEDEKTPQAKPPTPQRGPLRWYDHEMRCTKKRCASPTYAKVDGIPRCMMHALQDLNELVITLTDRLENHYKGVKVSENENEETKPENASDAEPGNQSEQEVAEIQQREREEDDGA